MPESISRNIQDVLYATPLKQEGLSSIDTGISTCVVIAKMREITLSQNNPTSFVWVLSPRVDGSNYSLS